MALYHLLDPFWRRFPFPARTTCRVDEMVPGVHRVRLARAYGGQEILPVYCYAVGDTLVDTGMPAAEREILAFVREHGIRRAVLTHHHEDHAGTAAALVEAGHEVVAPPLTARLVASDMPLLFYQHLAWGRMRPALVGVFQDTVAIGPCEARVVPAPGHCVDLVVLHVAERGWLFAGDVFIHERIKMFRRDEDFAATIDSLERVLELDFDVLFCGHRPVKKDGKAALARKLDWLRGVEDGVRRHHAAGCSVREIVRRVGLGRRNAFSAITMGDASSVNLVRSVLEGPRPRREVQRVVEAFRHPGGPDKQES